MWTEGEPGRRTHLGVCSDGQVNLEAMMGDLFHTHDCGYYSMIVFALVYFSDLFRTRGTEKGEQLLGRTSKPLRGGAPDYPTKTIVPLRMPLRSRRILSSFLS
jgi:hypothetical protein